MYCKICEAETPDNATYCAGCKAKLEKRQRLVDNYGAIKGPPARRHHLYLGLFLLFISIITSLKTISFIPTIYDKTLYVPGTTDVWNPWTHWSTGVSLLLSIALLYFAIAIWKWKRWGIFGYLATAVIHFIVDIVSKPSIVSTYYTWYPSDESMIVATVIMIYIVIIVPLPLLLWLDKSGGWGHQE